MASKAAFPGTVGMTVPFAGHLSTFSLKRSGIPKFRDPYYGHYGGFDHINLKDEGETNSTSVGYRAVINAGKTAEQQTHALRMRTRHMDGRRFRFAYDDHRTRKGEPEAEKLCRICGYEEAKVSNYQFNFVDMNLGFEFGEQLDFIMESFRFVINRDFTIQEAAALRYSLKKLRNKFPKTAEPWLFHMCLQSLDHDEVVELRREIRGELENRHKHDPEFRKMAEKLSKAEALESFNGTVDNDSQLRAILNVSIEDVLRASQLMALALELLLDGPFGKLFGGRHSVAEVMQREAVVFDYSGLSGESMTLFQSMLWRIKASAIARDDHRLFCDAEYHDENPTLWRYLVYARAMSLYLKRLRSTSVYLALATHRRKDYATVGNVGSEAYNLAMNMENDINIWMLGAMGHEEALETQAFHQLSNHQRLLLEGWRRRGMVGNWLVKMGSAEPFPVETNLTRLELEITASNAANDAYVVKDPHFDFDYWEEGDTLWLPQHAKDQLQPV